LSDQNTVVTNRFTDREFRTVLGTLPTGVVIVTGLDSAGEPAAMTIGTFASVSLEPSLVMFMPSKTSKSWAALRESATGYCINVLSSQQEEACLAVTQRASQKLDGIPWSMSEYGNARIEGSLAYIEVEVVEVVDAGDHDMVLCSVRALDCVSVGDPLVFFRGGFGSFKPRTLMSAENFVFRGLWMAGLAREKLADLADRLNAFVTITKRIGDELVLVASAGDPRGRSSGTQLGSRMPFMAPLGIIYAAWTVESEQERWLSPLSAPLKEHYRELLDDTRDKGYAFTVGVGHSELELLVERMTVGREAPDQFEIDAVLSSLASNHNPLSIDEEGSHQLRAILVPVFDEQGEVALVLAVWTPFPTLNWAELHEQIRVTVDAGHSISELISNSNR